ncbi:MAG: hypothetical protein J6T53_04960 [Bacteroidales bacterium]|nr:hypothetical protein [Bacteroidales bacterium]
MKLIKFIITAIVVTLLTLLQSCDNYDLFSSDVAPLHKNVLKPINDTMTAHPDIALDMIIKLADTIDGDNMTKNDYFEYQILVAEALFKNNYQQTNDSAVIETVRFYDSLAQQHSTNTDVLLQQARAHYYRGVALEEKELILEACSEYYNSLKTLDNIDVENNDRKDIKHFKALTYNRLAWLYYSFNSTDISLFYLNNANDLFIACNDYQSTITNIKLIAGTFYHEKQNTETTLYYLNIADSLINEVPINAASIRDINSLRATYLFDNGEKALAYDIMDNIIEEAETDKEIMTFYYVLAEMYFKDKNFSYALFFYEKAFPRDRNTMIGCASRIIEICKITGDTETANYYAPYLAEESLDEISISPISTELTTLYDQYYAEKHLRAKRRAWITAIIIIICVTAAGFLVLEVIMIIKRKRHKKEIGEKNWFIGVLQGKIKSAHRESDIMKKKMKLMHDDITKIKAGIKREPIIFEERLSIIMQDETCRNVGAMQNIPVKTDCSYPELVIDEETRRHIVEVCDRNLDGTLQQIMTKYPKLKYDDKIIFSLYLLGLDDKHIAAVTGKNYHQHYKRIQRYRDMFDNTGNLKLTLVEMINQITSLSADMQ